jgi:hypothetical protein
MLGLVAIVATMDRSKVVSEVYIREAKLVRNKGVSISRSIARRLGAITRMRKLRCIESKLSFPKFHGENPRIWLDKCADYLCIFNIPEPLWTTLASLHMEDNATKWLQVFKLKHDVGTWTEFVARIVMLILMDSGSSHSFVSQSFVFQASLSTTKTTPV